MRTFIEIWHTDKDGWTVNHYATRDIIRDEKGVVRPFGGWTLPQPKNIYDVDDINVLRKLLDAIEKELLEDNN